MYGPLPITQDEVDAKAEAQRMALVGTAMAPPKGEVADALTPPDMGPMQPPPKQVSNAKV